KKLLKLLQEPGVKSQVQRVELDVLADRKLPAREQKLRHIEDELYFVLDERGHSVHLSEKGVETMSPQDPNLFVVPDISHAVHEIEHDEHLSPKEEIQTLATITIQNYFRMYDKLAGMTGTAETEETEFFQIYGLEVVVIPTNRPVRRVDKHDLIYKTRREKYNALMDEVERQHKRG